MPATASCAPNTVPTSGARWPRISARTCRRAFLRAVINPLNGASPPGVDVSRRSDLNMLRTCLLVLALPLLLAAGPDPAVHEVPASLLVPLLGIMAGTPPQPAGAKEATRKDIGRIIDVLVDEYGQPRAAVLDVGGF